MTSVSASLPCLSQFIGFNLYSQCWNPPLACQRNFGPIHQNRGFYGSVTVFLGCEDRVKTDCTVHVYEVVCIYVLLTVQHRRQSFSPKNLTSQSSFWSKCSHPYAGLLSKLFHHCSCHLKVWFVHMTIIFVCCILVARILSTYYPVWYFCSLGDHTRDPIFVLLSELVTVFQEITFTVPLTRQHA